MTGPVRALADRVAALVPAGERTLVAIAGAPASGKTTLSETLARVLSARGHPAAVVPMDGFHLDNAILTERGLLPRKGAPETFDAAGFVNMVRRIAAGEEVIYPQFDRARDIAIAGACRIRPDQRIVVFEGNYLLFDEPPWRELAALWDLAVRLDVAEDHLRKRLVQRWLDHGLPLDQAVARAEGNDISNARRVAANALPADLTLS